MTTTPLSNGFAGDGASATSSTSMPRAAAIARTSLRAARLAPASVATYTEASATPTRATRSSVAGAAERNRQRAATTAATPAIQPTTDSGGTRPVFATISTVASAKNAAQRQRASRLREYVSSAAPPSSSQNHGSM